MYTITPVVHKKSMLVQQILDEYYHHNKMNIQCHKSKNQKRYDAKYRKLIHPTPPMNGVK